MVLTPSVLVPLIVEYLPLVPQAIVTGVIMGMAYALVAAGLALIWGVVDIVNFAHGEYMLIAMYVTIIGANDFGVDPIFLVPLNAVVLFVAVYAVGHSLWAVTRAGNPGLADR